MANRICKRWTEEEDCLLRQLYPKTDSISHLRPRFPERSRKAITSRASFLGLVFNDPRQWAQEEENLLRQLYPKTHLTKIKTLLPLFPGRTLSAIRQRATGVLKLQLLHLVAKDGQKTCYQCGKTRPTDQFSKDKRTKDGFSSVCKRCHGKRRFKKYKNFDEIQYLEKVKQQNGICPMCEKYFGDKLVIDHHHGDDHVRGLLCKTCNLSLGNCGDSPIVMLNGFYYLLEDEIKTALGNHKLPLDSLQILMAPILKLIGSLKTKTKELRKFILASDRKDPGSVASLVETSSSFHRSINEEKIELTLRAGQSPLARF